MNVILEQINSTGKAFVEFAFAGLVQSSVLIVILLLVDLALRRKVRAVFRYWLWMLVLAKLVLPTSLSSPVSLGHWFGDKLENVKIVRQTTAVNPQEAPQPIEPDPIEVGIPSPPVISPPAEIIKPSVMIEMATEPTVLARAVTPVTWQAVVFLVWLAVVGAMGLLLLQRAIFVRGLVTQAREGNSLMKDALEFCREQMGVKRRVALKVSANATSPAVCGIWCYVILLPRNLGRSLGSRDLRAVLLHELAHIKRGDLWVNFVQTVLQIVYFYNPLLWFANAIIRRVREQAVDETVLVAMGEKAQWYPQTLVSVAKLAFKRPALSLRLIGVVESKSALTGRIKRILNRPMPKSAKLGVLGLVVVIVAGCVLLPMARAEREIRNPVQLDENGRPIITHTLYMWGQIEEPIYQLEDKTYCDVDKLVTHIGELMEQYPFLMIRVRATTQFLRQQEPIEDLSKRCRDIRFINMEFKYDLTLPPDAFQATLPNGVTVELVGVCEYPSDGKQWWRPDGTPYILPAGITIEDRLDKVGDDAYQFLFSYNSQEELKWNSLDVVCLHFSIEGHSGTNLINFRRLPEAGQDGLVAKVAIFKEPLDSTTIQANLATGNWQTRAIRDISKIDQRNEDLWWFTSRSAGHTSLDILHRIEGQQIKTIAIDREGNEYHASCSLGSFGGWMRVSGVIKGTQKDERRYWTGLRKDDRLVKFKLQSRPFWSSVIGNVSLKRNFKSHVRVEDGENISAGTVGYIVDGSGRGIAGATVEFYRWDRKEKKTTEHQIIKTGNDGSFVIPYMEPGQRVSFVNITAPGFGTREDVDFICKVDGTYWPEDKTIQLFRLRSLAGTVLDLDGKPLAGAPLSLSTHVQYQWGGCHTFNHIRAITDANGHFSMNVPPGTHLLSYPWMGPIMGEVWSGKWDKWKKPGERYPSAPIKGVSWAKGITISEGQAISGITADLSKSTCDVTGKVRDTRGQPVQGAKVRMLWLFDGGSYICNGEGYEPAVTDRNGNYRLENLPPGKWHITAWHEQVKQNMDPVPLELVRGKTVQQDLRLGGELPVRVEPIATLPNGVTVELVGVCEHPSEGKQWWRPDGTVLEEAPIKEDRGINVTTGIDRLGRKFAVKLTKLPEGFSGNFADNLKYEIVPCYDHGLSGPVFKNGKPLSDVWLISGSIPSENTHCTLKLLISNDKWVEFKNVSLRPGGKTDVESEPVLLEELNRPERPATSPCLSADGLTMYFGRQGEQRRIYEAYRAVPNGLFTSERVLSELYNGEGIYTPCVSPDGLRLYYSEFENFTTRHVIRMAERASPSGSWTKVRDFYEIHVEGGADFGPSLTADELTMFFRTDRNEGVWEIWQATRSSKQEPFSNPMPVSELNDGDGAGGVCIMPDGLTIYFAAIRDGRASYDIYKATRLSTDDPFGNIELISISSDVYGEFYPFVVTADEGTLYFAQHWGGERGIYVSYWRPQTITVAVEVGGEGGWGEAVNGVRARLRSKGPYILYGTYGARSDVLLGIENQSGQKIQIEYPPQYFKEDKGKWRDLGRIEILDMNDYPVQPTWTAPLKPSIHTINYSKHERIAELTIYEFDFREPGKYKIRVTFKVQPAESGEAFAVSTNWLEFEALLTEHVPGTPYTAEEALREAMAFDAILLRHNRISRAEAAEKFLSVADNYPDTSYELKAYRWASVILSQRLVLPDNHPTKEQREQAKLLWKKIISKWPELISEETVFARHNLAATDENQFEKLLDFYEWLTTRTEDKKVESLAMWEGDFPSRIKTFSEKLKYINQSLASTLDTLERNLTAHRNISQLNTILERFPNTHLAELARKVLSKRNSTTEVK